MARKERNVFSGTLLLTRKRWPQSAYLDGGTVPFNRSVEERVSSIATAALFQLCATAAPGQPAQSRSASAKSPSGLDICT